MPFNQESKGYAKTILSDLQGAWSLLRQSVVEAAGFDGWERAIFHIDEAMSWEVVRDLRLMPPLLLIIKNICFHGQRQPSGHFLDPDGRPPVCAR